MFRRVFSSTTTAAAAFVATAGSSICSGSVTMGQPQQMRFKTTASANKNSGTPNDTQQLNQQFQSLEDFELTTAQSSKSSWYRDLDTAFTVGSGLAEESQKPVVSAEFASSHMKDVPCVSSEETPWLLSSSSSSDEFRHLSAASSEKFGLSSSAVKETIAAAAAAPAAEKPVIDEQQTFLVKKQKFTVKTNHFFRKASKAALNKANSNRKSQQQ